MIVIKPSNYQYLVIFGEKDKLLKSKNKTTLLIDVDFNPLDVFYACSSDKEIKRPNMSESSANKLTSIIEYMKIHQVLTSSYKIIFKTDGNPFEILDTLSSGLGLDEFVPSINSTMIFVDDVMFLKLE